MPECKTIAEVRENIDRLDRMIVPLLAERSRYVHEAARFKGSKAAVVVPERIQEIIDKVRAQAAELGCEPDLMEDLYRAMIDAFIRSEQRVWEKLSAK